MKRLLYISLVFIWILSVSGVVVSKHYCGPFLKTIQIGHSVEHCCTDTADEPEGCCKNTTEYASLDDDFLKVEKLASACPNLFVLYSVDIPYFLLSDAHLSTSLFPMVEDTGPRKQSLPPYISFGALLI